MPTQTLPTILNILPRETRDQIWELVFAHDKPILPQIVYPSEEDIILALNEYRDPAAPEATKFRHMNEYLSYAPVPPIKEDDNAAIVNGKTHSQRVRAHYTPRTRFIRTFLMPTPSMTRLQSLTLVNRQIHNETKTLFYALNVLDFGAHYYTLHAYLVAIHARSATRHKTLPFKINMMIRMSDIPDEEGIEAERRDLFPALAMLLRTGSMAWERNVCFGDVGPILRLVTTKEYIEKMTSGWELDWLKICMEGFNVRMLILDENGREREGAKSKKVKTKAKAKLGTEGYVDLEDENEGAEQKLMWRNGKVMEAFIPVTWEAEKQDRRATWAVPGVGMDCREHCGCDRSQA